MNTRTYEHLAGTSMAFAAVGGLLSYSVNSDSDESVGWRFSWLFIFCFLQSDHFVPVALTKHIPPVSLSVEQRHYRPLLMCLCGVVEWRKNKLNLGNPPAGINVKVVGRQMVTQTVTIQKASSSVLTYNRGLLSNVHMVEKVLTVYLLLLSSSMVSIFC